MRRRDFGSLLGGMAAFTTWSSPLNAQQKATPVIGFLDSSSPNPNSPNVAAFRQGLSETGYVEGQNVAIEYRWAEGHFDRLPALAAEALTLGVLVLVRTSRHAPPPVSSAPTRSG